MPKFQQYKTQIALAALTLLWITSPTYASVFTVGSTSTKTAPELKLSIQGKHKSSSKYSWKAPKLTLATPITANWDIAVEAIYAIVDPAQGATHSGPGDAEIKSKWNFYSAQRLNLAAQGKLTLPTGDEDRGLGAGDATFKLPLLLSYRLNDRWALGGAVAIKHVFHRDKDSGYAAVLLTRKLGDNLKLGTEWVAKTKGITIHHPTHWLDVGFKWTFGHNFNLQGLFGHEIHTADASAHANEYKFRLEKKFK